MDRYEARALASSRPFGSGLEDFEQPRKLRKLDRYEARAYATMDRALRQVRSQLQNEATFSPSLPNRNKGLQVKIVCLTWRLATAAS